MKTILLPGFSLENKQWADEVVAQLQEEGIPVHVLEWNHWSSGDTADFDPYIEAERLSSLVGENEEVTLLAKSIGTLVASIYATQNPEDIFMDYIFLGVPLHDLEGSDLDVMGEFLEQRDDGALIMIQNSQDPHASAEEVESFVHRYQPELDVMQMDSMDHSYPYYDLFKDLLDQSIE